MSEALTTTTAPKPAEAKLITVSPGRPPYPTKAQASFGIDVAGWRALIDAVWPSAKTTEAVILALSYCKARNLDPFKRPVHIVPVWDSKQQREVETIWPGIGELRTTASRTGDYGGFDEAVFGPEESRAFKGVVGKGQYAKEVTKEVAFPAWCQITVYRIVQGQRVGFPGPRVRWLETYATMGASDVPNEMWATRPYGQLEKCAEAAALRRAFPEEVGSEQIHDEVGRRAAAIDVTPAVVPEGSRSEILAERLSGEGAVVDVGPAADFAPEPAGPVQVADDLRVPVDARTRDAVVEDLRALLKKHGKSGPTRDEALQSAYGDPSWIRVIKLPVDQLEAGLRELRRQLEGLADMAADREPGEEG